MKTLSRFFVIAGLLAPCLASAQAPAPSVPKGKMAYTNQCANCHRTSTENTVDGPGLQGIFGQKAAQREGFAYSDAMKNQSLVWDEATLDKYLEAPDKVVPGGKMTLAVPKVADRANIIAYLKTLKPGS